MPLLLILTCKKCKSVLCALNASCWRALYSSVSVGPEEDGGLWARLDRPLELCPAFLMASIPSVSSNSDIATKCDVPWSLLSVIILLSIGVFDCFVSWDAAFSSVVSGARRDQSLLHCYVERTAYLEDHRKELGMWRRVPIPEAIDNMTRTTIQVVAEGSKQLVGLKFRRYNRTWASATRPGSMAQAGCRDVTARTVGPVKTS